MYELSLQVNLAFTQYPKEAFGISAFILACCYSIGGNWRD